MLCCLLLCLPQAANSQTTTNPDDGPDVSLETDGIITNGLCNAASNSHVNILTGDNHNWGAGDVLQFGACNDTFAIAIGINAALAEAGSGISLDKVHYKWQWINGCFNVTKPDGTTIYCDQDIENRLDENFKPTGEFADQFDDLKVVVTITDSSGDLVETRTYDYDTWFHWHEENAHSDNEVQEGNSIWQVTEDVIELFNHSTGSGTIYSPEQLGNLTFVVTSSDNGNWDGYYGPVVKGGDAWFTYRANPCELDTLFNPSCPGYAEAYATYLYNTNCTASPLYDIGCPGYATAYHNQQCTNDPLYDSSCSGYATAYYNQQCSANALYDSGCPGYESALYDQSCTADPLYDSGCPEYATAYYNQQCTADALYDSGCPGYETAYFNQQCTADATYDAGCPGYENAYLYKQCKIDVFYSPSCEGYDAAYLSQQCAIDDLYDKECPNYASAYLDQQCTYDSLYDIQCPMYQVALFNQQCELDPQSDISCPDYKTITDAPDIADPVADLIKPPAVTVEIIPDMMPEMVELPIINIPLPPVIPLMERPVMEPEITMESLDIEIAQMEIELNETRPEEPIKEVGPEPEPDTTDTSGEGDSGSEPEPEPKPDTTESEENNGSEPEPDGESEEPPVDEPSESEDNDGEEKDAGEDTSTEGDDETDEKEKPVEDEKDDETDEKETDDKDKESEDEGEVKSTTETDDKPVKKEKPKPEPTEKEKKDSRTKKIKQLIASKIATLKAEIGDAKTIEEQMAKQSQLVALIAFVPNFDYTEMEVPKTFMYPPKPTIDHQFSRFFLNDPTFGAMEDLQYPSLRQ